MVKKRGTKIQININLSNRIIYTLITAFILITIGVVVYASYANPVTGVGHEANDIGEGTIGGILTILGGKVSIAGATDIDSTLIIKDGKIGIGTNSPGAMLSIVGPGTATKPMMAFRQSDALTYGYDFGWNATTGNFLMFPVNADVVGTSGLSMDRATGNVGIGTTSPSAGLKLDIEGKVGATEYCDQNGNNCKSITSMGSGVERAWSTFSTGAGYCGCPTGWTQYSVIPGGVPKTCSGVTTTASWACYKTF